MLQESVSFGELDLASTTGAKLSISPITDGQIVILIPLSSEITFPIEHSWSE